MNDLAPTGPAADQQDPAAATQAETTNTGPARRRRRHGGGRPASRRRGAPTRAQARAVLDRYRTLCATDDATLAALAVVLGSSGREARDLTVDIVSGSGPRHLGAMNDLLAIASAADADRDMAALTLAVGASGMKRLRAAWALADSLSDRARPLPSSPVEAARALVPAAVEAARTLTAVKTLLD